MTEGAEGEQITLQGVCPASGARLSWQRPGNTREGSVVICHSWDSDGRQGSGATTSKQRGSHDASAVG